MSAELDPRICAAMQRVASGIARGADKEAQRISMEAAERGRFGSSYHSEGLRETYVDAHRKAAEQVSETLLKFAGTNAALYRGELERILRESATNLRAIYERHFSRNSRYSEMLVPYNLSGVFDDISANVIDEFDLAVLGHYNSSATGDDYSMQIAILAHYARVPKAHKMNVIGRASQPGALEAELGIRFANEDRARAARCFGQLVDAGHLQSDFSDIVDPENWLSISPAGREAAKNGAIDDLDAALSAIDPNLVAMRHGAWAASLRDSQMVLARRRILAANYWFMSFVQSPRTTTSKRSLTSFQRAIQPVA